MFVYIRNAYKPFRSFISFFDLTDNVKASEPEYEKNIHAYTNIRNENAKRDRELYYQDGVLLNSVLSNIISDGELFYNISDETVNRFSLFKKSLWCVVQFVTETLEYTTDETKVIISNIFEELLETEGFEGKTIRAKDCFVCVVGADKDEQNITDRIVRIISSLQEVVDKYFSIGIKAAENDVLPEIENIRRLYKESENAMYHKILYNLDGIICYNELKDLPEQKNIIDEYISRCTELIKAGKTDEAAEYILKHFDITNKYPESPGTVFNIVNIFLLLVGKSFDTIDLSKQNYHEKLVRLSEKNLSRDKKKEIIRDIIKNLSSESGEIKKQDIVEFIKENYANQNLTVSYIAEVFNIHPNTLSARFKNEIGVSVPWYINYTRIKESKKLLRNKGMTLDEIAQSVGYTGAKTYIRNFKKYENITPRGYIENKEIL